MIGICARKEEKQRHIVFAVFEVKIMRIGQANARELVSTIWNKPANKMLRRGPKYT